MGNEFVKVRWQVGWSSVFSSYYAPYGYWLDDLSITGLVYNDNLKVTGLDVIDPLPVRGTPDISTELVNAGVNDQLSANTKVKLTIGPQDKVEVMTEDHEGYASELSHPWSHAGASDQWGFPSNDANSGTRAWGPGSGSGYLFNNGGADARLITDSMDLSDAPDDAIMTMTHRYSWALYPGYSYGYSGSWVEASVDGDEWQLVTPTSGYPGAMYEYYYGANRYAFVGTSSDWMKVPLDISDLTGESDVRFAFRYMTYEYYNPTYYEDLYWYIDDISIAGTAVDLTRAYVDEFTLASVGQGATFDSGERLNLLWGTGSADIVRPAFTFNDPGAYKITIETWIDGFVGGLDDYEDDNQESLARETMFTLVFSDASEELEDSDFTSVTYSGGADLGWTPIAASDAYSPPRVWDIGDDSTLSTYSGDDTALLSPVFDLSKAMSAKVVFKHRYSFFSSGTTLYDGGNVEISTDGGGSWSVLEPTAGKGYDGTVYNYAYYGNPLASLRAFGGSQPMWVETQIRLDEYLGDGMDNLQLRWHMGGRFYDDDPMWQIDDVGLYALGFDVQQESMEAPYRLELDEAATLTTSYFNLGAGHVGAGEVVEDFTVYGYIYDITEEGLELYWNSDGDTIDDLPMAVSTGEISIAMPGVADPGAYRIGIMVGDFDVDGNKMVFQDLFRANNDKEHVLVVGTAQEGGVVLPLDGGGAFEVLGSGRETVPDYVGSALKIVYDETDVLSGSVDIDMPAAQLSFSPNLVTVTKDTEVTWTNSDTLSHTVTSPWFDSGNLGPGGTFSYTFEETGTYDYYCSYYRTSGMEGTIIVKEAARIDEVASTPYMKLWTADTMLMFWAKYDMSEGDIITLEASRKGDPTLSIPLNSGNGFELYDGFSGAEVEEGLTGDTKGDDGELEWRLYYLNLQSSKNDDRLNLEYSTYRANADGTQVRFQFRVAGDEGMAYLGGVELVRTLPYGMFWTLGSDENAGTIFPGTDATVTYYAHNIGVYTNTLEFTPSVLLQKTALPWNLEFEASDASSGGALQTVRDEEQYTIEVAPNQAIMIEMTVNAPEYSAELGTPGSGQYKVVMAGTELGGGTVLSAPPSYYLEIIDPDVAVIGVTLPGAAVLDGQAMEITAELANYGNYVQDVVVYFYHADPNGQLLSGGTSPWPSTRMTFIGAATVDLLEPVQVLEAAGKDVTSKTVSVVWEGPEYPDGAFGDYQNVPVYVWANPSQQEIIQQGDNELYKNKDEDSNKRANNFEDSSVRIVRNVVTTSSFALALWGLAFAGIVSAVSISVSRRRE